MLQTNKTTQLRVSEIISDQLGTEWEQITLEADLVKDLGADSLDTVEIMMALEEEFEIEISDEEAEKIKTVGDIVKYIDGLPHAL